MVVVMKVDLSVGLSFHAMGDDAALVRKRWRQPIRPEAEISGCGCEATLGISPLRVAAAGKCSIGHEVGGGYFPSRRFVTARSGLIPGQMAHPRMCRRAGVDIARCGDFWGRARQREKTCIYPRSSVPLEDISVVFDSLVTFR